MPATSMNHFTILTDNVEGTLAFYADMLDLHPGARPPFKFPGAWLYARGGNDPILHVIGYFDSTANTYNRDINIKKNRS